MVFGGGVISSMAEITTPIAVSVRGVSKKYRLFASHKHRIFEALHPFGKRYHHEFWALKDVNFDIFKGETLGIVGRNGSGKSTLLDVICGILRPTEGSVEITGRISALLELGSGFNPEFTGRDNVFMHGILMGFSKKEMEGRLAGIESFADIGEFIDQPVKLYSSGMFVRLAFACAVNVDSDIIVIDEALAVGDAKFQNKCYAALHEYQEQGKTIILVTHDTGAILKQCSRAILLEHGSILKIGAPQDVVNRYFEILFDVPPNLAVTDSSNYLESSDDGGDKSDTAQSKIDAFLANIPDRDLCPSRHTYNKNEERYGDRRGEILDYLLVCGSQLDPDAIDCGAELDIFLKVRFVEEVRSPHYGFCISSLDAFPVFGTNTTFLKAHTASVQSCDVITMKFTVEMNVSPGDYFIDVGIGETINDNFVPVDRRVAMIHLRVQGDSSAVGYSYLATKVTEEARTSAPPATVDRL